MTTYVRKDGGVTVTITLDEATLARWNQTGGMINRYVFGKAGRAAVFARQYAPVKSGKLRDGIRVEQARTAGRYTSGYQVVSTAPHSVYVVKGTRPHRITGNPLLAFKVGSQTVFAQSVNHPGTKANDFMTRALQATMAGSR